MIEAPFIAGFVMGALLVGSAFTIYLTRSRRPRREIAQWTDEHYQPPVVTRVTVNRHRSFDI